MSTSETNRPAHTVRHGRIKATIWCNETQKGPMYNVTLTRSYQDEQKNWHDTQSFGVGDLMTLAKCAFDAHTWISGEMAKNGGEGKGGSDGKSEERRSALDQVKRLTRNGNSEGRRDERGNPQRKPSSQRSTDDIPY